MEEKSLIKGDTFINKVKRKIFEIINKIKKKPKQVESQEDTIDVKIETNGEKNKQEVLDLYKKAKKQEVNLHTIGIKKLQMLVKLAEEEVSILRHKYENEIIQQKINEKEIEYCKQKLEKLKNE